MNNAVNEYCSVSNSVMGWFCRLLLANKTTNKHHIRCNYSCCTAVGPDKDCLMRRKKRKNDDCWKLRAVCSALITRVKSEPQRLIFPRPRRGVDRRIFATSLSPPAMHRGDLRWHGLVRQGNGFFEQTYLSLEGQHICSSDDPRLRLSVWDLAHFRSGSRHAWRHVTVCDAVETRWARTIMVWLREHADAYTFGPNVKQWVTITFKSLLNG